MKSTTLGLALLVLAFQGVARADYTPPLTQESLVIAKFAGGCAVLYQLHDFQAQKKLPGGDDFLKAFIANEVQRLGTTEAEYSAKCEQVLGLYRQMYDEVAPKPQPQGPAR